MEKILNDSFNATKFAELIQSRPELQLTFNELKYKYSGLLSKIYEHEHGEQRKKNNVMRWQEELKAVNAEIPGVESAIEAIDNPEVKKEYENKLSNLKSQKERLEQSLERNNSSTIFGDTLDYAAYQEKLKALDSLIDKLGQWFESGALGEGTVTFNDKTFTYPKG